MSNWPGARPAYVCRLGWPIPYAIVRAPVTFVGQSDVLFVSLPGYGLAAVQIACLAAKRVVGHSIAGLQHLFKPCACLQVTAGGGWAGFLAQLGFKLAYNRKFLKRVEARGETILAQLMDPPTLKYKLDVISEKDWKADGYLMLNDQMIAVHIASHKVVELYKVTMLPLGAGLLELVNVKEGIAELPKWMAIKTMVRACQQHNYTCLQGRDMASGL